MSLENFLILDPPSGHKDHKQRLVESESGKYVRVEQLVLPVDCYVSELEL